MRRFDRRKQVFQHDPEYVVRELSQIMDFIMTQALHDIDIVLADEYGVSPKILNESSKDSLDLSDVGEDSE